MQWTQLDDATRVELTKLQQPASAERPATLLDKVKQLGHYPKRCKNPATDKERADNSLAEKISKQWSSLDDATKAELTRLQQPATLLEQVEQLGHYPNRYKNPKTDEEHAENSLAEKISKQWSKLDNATKAELTRLQQETQSKDAEEKQEDILERLRAFGKWPQEHDYSGQQSRHYSRSAVGA